MTVVHVGRVATIGRLEAVTGHRPLAALLLAVPGALLAHSIAYLWTHPGSITLDVGRSHGYMPVAGPLVGLAGMVVLVWLAILGVRATGPDTKPGVLRLAVLQALVFLTQETVELLTGGASLVELLGEPAILLGLALQLPVAALLIWLVRVGSVLVELLFVLNRPGAGSSQESPLPALAMVAARPVVLSVGRRGPPVVV
ncbi:MAG: hypothetical protein QF638_09450 [Acidimicrobiales bacterium]|nr:hypothetical protein [Acidimicrobiales bacterium]MDP7258134.1 hypothetical protein [Acidimicrobiales bacterium]